MKVKLGEQIFLSYKRLSYKVWYAIAEFVDNSTQAYINKQALLDKVYAKEKSQLTVSIELGVDFIRIKDNSIGMSEHELQQALTVGKPPKIISGRSRYGLGLKTGACWLGDLWTVTTKKYGQPTEYKITFDVGRVAGGDKDLRKKERSVPIGEHYTEIEIEKLHRQIPGNSVRKIKNYLRSIYRVDLKMGKLVLKWGEEELKWDEKKEIDDRLRKNKDGSLARRKFSFKLSKKKTVRGWAGVFDPGKRGDAGFSIIQANRVIKGWPAAWRPELIFGEQEGGRNDLINQRLVGEIHLEGFEVSHTKDDILFDQDEERKLEKKIKGKIPDLIKLAREYRAEQVPTRVAGNRLAALNQFEKEVSSDKVRNMIENYILPNVSLWTKSNTSLLRAISKRSKPAMRVRIGQLNLLLYFNEAMSPNDPYVIYEATVSEDFVIIVLNLSHPHWRELTKQESILNFIRHCAYDGVAEWKSYFTIGKIEPDTVKLIKDNLLRSTFEVAD